MKQRRLRLLLCLCLLLLLVSWSTSPSWPRDVSLAWDEYPGDQNVTGFRIYYGNASGQYQHNATVGFVTEATITGLADELPWYFAATARRADGAESGFSSEAHILAQQQSIAPATDVAINYYEGSLVASYVNRGLAENGGVTLNGVTAGNLIVAVLIYSHYNDTPSISDGTTSLTAGNLIRNPTGDTNDDLVTKAFWLLSANGGNKTYTPSGVTNDYRLHVFEFSGTGSWELDGQSAAGTGESGTTITSGTLTTTGSEVVLIGWANAWTSESYSSHAIGGSAASGAGGSGYEGTTCYRIATLSDGTFSVTASTSSQWVAGLIAFKVAGAPAASILRQMLAHH